MATKFKAHKMYGPKGQVVMAKTMKQHLALKAKKYNHKPKKKPSPGLKRGYKCSK